MLFSLLAAAAKKSCTVYGASFRGKNAGNVPATLNKIFLPATLTSGTTGTTSTVVGLVGVDELSALAIHPKTKVLYGISRQGPTPTTVTFTLLVVDKLTGAGVPVPGSTVPITGLVSVQAITDMSFDPSTAVLYVDAVELIAPLTVQSVLYRIGLDGVATRVGTISSSAVGIGLSFGPTSSSPSSPTALFSAPADQNTGNTFFVPG